MNQARSLNGMLEELQGDESRIKNAPNSGYLAVSRRLLYYILSEREVRWFHSKKKFGNSESEKQFHLSAIKSVRIRNSDRSKLIEFMNGIGESPKLKKAPSVCEVLNGLRNRNGYVQNAAKADDIGVMKKLLTVVEAELELKCIAGNIETDNLTVEDNLPSSIRNAVRKRNSALTSLTDFMDAKGMSHI